MDFDATTVTLLSYTIVTVLVATVLVLPRWRQAPTGHDSKNRASEPRSIPFLTLHDPDWSTISKAISAYEREIGACLEGLSYSLETCLHSEASLGLEDGVFSRALRDKIATFSDLTDHNRDVMRDLLGEFPTNLMLPTISFQESIGNVTCSTTATDSTSQHNGTEDPPPRQGRYTTAEPSSYDSIGQIVAHMVRDWTPNGKLVRASVYDWCRVNVQGIRKTILIPGAGLGRLAMDLAQDGHLVEANEVSFTMAAAAYNIFRKQDEFTLYPFLGDLFVNEVNSKLRYQAVQVQPPRQKAVKGHLSYTIGDFVQIYGSPQASQYDVVITCFFLDTATNILTYLAVLSNILSTGGKWINVGPVQWHSNARLHPAADELKTLIRSFGFRIDDWSVDAVPVDYRTEDPATVRFTKYEGYQPVRMVATKSKNRNKRFLVPSLATEPEPVTLRKPQQTPPSSVTIEELVD